jgi:hypothetical protein
VVRTRLAALNGQVVCDAKSLRKAATDATGAASTTVHSSFQRLGDALL